MLEMFWIKAKKGSSLWGNLFCLLKFLTAYFFGKSRMQRA